MPVWKLVHIVVRWAMLVVAEQEGRDSLRMPVLSQLQLGRFMSRADASTCMDIAMDVLRQTSSRDVFTDDQIRDTILSIRRQSESGVGKIRGYSRKTDSLIVAREMLAAVERQIVLRNELEAFWVCCRTTTWAEATSMLRGRDWQSVRDDFRKWALVLWSAEAAAIASSADRMSTVMAEQRQRA